ncbi:MAG: hypothetical protein PHF17_11280 [Arcobacteraceae bacterium]|nr:hypothetical protein [Arcobacteraceae bacterium]
MESKINNQVETTSTETIETVVATSESTIAFNEATIIQNINVDSYTKEVNVSYILESLSTGDKARIKDEGMLVIAEGLKSQSNFNYLIVNGWKGSDKMKEGAGTAIKLEKKGTYYYCTLYTGVSGEQFDVNKVVRKSYLKIPAKTLDAIFIFVINNHMVGLMKAEKLKTQRTSLNLD